MLQSPVQPLNCSLRVRKKSPTADKTSKWPAEFIDDQLNPLMDDMFDDDDMGSAGDGGNVKGRNKSRRELPAGAVATLKAWLLSPEHFTHPYPTPQDQVMLMQKTGIDKKQLKNWFTNARRRIWKPMLKKQIEQGKLTATGGIPGSIQGLLMPSMAGAPAPNGSMDNPHSVQAMRVHYQQVVDQTQSQQQQSSSGSTDIYGNSIYSSAPSNEQTNDAHYYSSTLPSDQGMQSNPQLSTSSSIGTLPQLSSSTQLSKTDSHAVLMELFARDQDLVRQATESARLKAEAKQHPQTTSIASQQQGANQNPMKAPSHNALPNVPTLNSWPHFSSITSLSNLGTIPGVKSVSSLSGADLASQGNLNKMGNLAQVKSMDSIGKNDSYAFLEVFFGGDRNSTNNLNAMGGRDQKGATKPSGDEDNEIGLSLEDESPSQSMRKEYSLPASVSGAPRLAALSSMGSETSNTDTGTLKRAYDDALAARGLMSVSRSCEKLTDLVLPAKIQRTLSQEFINREKHQQYGQYSYPPASAPVGLGQEGETSHQHPGQHAVEMQEERSSQYKLHYGKDGASSVDPSEGDGHVQVPSETICALCSQTNVDTQLRPCGHMFHERCLKPSLQTPVGPPKCPIDHIPMQSALLAVPTDNPQPQQQKQQNSWSYSSNGNLQTLSTESPGL
jgi:hypothetical protein